MHNGGHWEDPFPLASDTDTSENLSPSVAVSGSYVHVVWVEGNKISYKRSTNNGANWEGTILLVQYGTPSEPSITASGSYLYLVWSDQRDGNSEIYYKRSTDNGQNWTPDIRLTNNFGSSTFPSIAISDTCLHLLWADSTSGNNEVYYKRNRHANLPTDVAVVALHSPPAVVDSGETITPACTVYNFGLTTVSYSVRMKIGNFYNETASVSNHTPGTKVYLTFPDWIATQRNNHIVSCSTELLGDENPRNETLIRSVFVRVRDVGTASITYPRGRVSPGPFIPQALVKNFGNTSETFKVRFVILQNGSEAYSADTIIPNLPGGDFLYVDFAEWDAEPGSYTARCSTYLVGDRNPVNDTISANFTVEQFAHDVGVVQILSPTGTILPNFITPRAQIHNYGQNPASFWVYFAISPSSRPNQVYLDSAEIANLPPGTSQEVSFSSWEAMVDEYTTKCTTALSGDDNSENDRRIGSVNVQRTPVG